MARDHDPETDAEIARLLAADNPEQLYEYDYGDGEDSDDPDYGAAKKKKGAPAPGKRGRGRPRKQAAGAEPEAAAEAQPVAGAADDAAAAAAAAGAAGEGAAAVLAAAAAAAAGAGALPVVAPPGGLPLPPPLPIPGLTPETLQAMMAQQQALMAAMAGAGGQQLGGLGFALPPGMGLALPPGLTLEQAALLGLPVMPLGLPPGSAAMPAGLPPGILGVGGAPAPAAPAAAAVEGGGKGKGKQSAAAADGGEGDEEYTATGRRKRKDTGKQRQQSRSWTDEEETLFLSALEVHGRDWKKCADHVGSRDHRAFTSHAQKHFIKLLLRGEEVPPRVAESGRGYTLSGKPLDPNSAAARAYGLKPELFRNIAASGKLLVGVHVSTLEALDGPPSAVVRRQPRAPGSGSGSAKRQKRGGGGGRGRGRHDDSDEYATPDEEEDEEEEEEELALLMQAQAAAEPTEYARNRPRRQAGKRTHMGDTTESLDLTHLRDFMGAPGTGAPMAQPFQVTVDKQALLVMDFHAHLSRCEVIGLLGGTFDPDRKLVEVQQAYPCRRAEGTHSGTSVELDAESQVEVAELMEQRGQRAVGWYHSHPVFEARPSLKDNENQRNYQAICRDDASQLEPWVGAIVSPYNDKAQSNASKVQLWVVKHHGGELAPFGVRAAHTGREALPSAETEDAIATAAEQLSDDPGRFDMSEWWAHEMAAPQPRIHKLREALSVHLPKDKPAEVAAFLDRVQQQLEQHWQVALPPPPPSAAALAAAEAAAGGEAAGGEAEVGGSSDGQAAAAAAAAPAAPELKPDPDVAAAGEGLDAARAAAGAAAGAEVKAEAGGEGEVVSPGSLQALLME